MVICVERGAYDLHMVQLMPLPPIISCFIKTQNGLLSWCRLIQVVLEKRSLNLYSYGEGIPRQKLKKRSKN